MLDFEMPVLGHLDFVKQDLCRDFKCHIFRVIYLGGSWTLADGCARLTFCMEDFKIDIFFRVLKSTEFHILSACTDVF